MYKQSLNYKYKHAYRLASRNVSIVKRFVRIRRRSAISRVNMLVYVCLCVCSIEFGFGSVNAFRGRYNKIIFLSGMEVRVDQRREQTLFFISASFLLLLYSYLIITLLFQLTNALCYSLTMRLEYRSGPFLNLLYFPFV